MELGQFDFLQTYIERLLDDNDFLNLSEETRAQLIPQFEAEAQRRIGLALLPHLDENAANQLCRLIDDPMVSPEKLRAFWVDAVPEFESIVEETLRDFAIEFRQVIANIP